jgi:hypothetical protein
LYFEEYKGTAHLEALEMLSSQANVKLEMCLLTKPYSKLDQRVKSELDVLDSYFDADKLNDDEDNESDDDDTEEEDFRLLINQKDKMFDVEHFEFLINEYVRKSSLNKIVIDKVMGAYRTTSYASKEILSPTELVDLFASWSPRPPAVTWSKLYQSINCAPFILLSLTNP